MFRVCACTVLYSVCCAIQTGQCNDDGVDAVLQQEASSSSNNNSNKNANTTANGAAIAGNFWASGTANMNLSLGR